MKTNKTVNNNIDLILVNRLGIESNSLIKENKLNLGLIETYKEIYEKHKLKISDYFKIISKKTKKEKSNIYSDIKDLLEKYINELKLRKEEYKMNINKIKETNSNMLNNFNKLIEKDKNNLENIKDTNFIYVYQLKEKKDFIKLIKNDMIQLKESFLFEDERHIYLNNNKENENSENAIYNELLNQRQIFSNNMKVSNLTRNKIYKLNKTLSELNLQKNSFIDKSLKNSISENIIDNKIDTFKLLNKEKEKKLNDSFKEEKFIFLPFELLNDNFDEYEKFIDYDLSLDVKAIKKENSIKFEKNKPPKLNLSQIEYNKERISLFDNLNKNKDININQIIINECKKEDNKINNIKSKGKNIDNEISILKINIKNLSKKNKLIKKIIKEFDSYREYALKYIKNNN